MSTLSKLLSPIAGVVIYLGLGMIYVNTATDLEEDAVEYIESSKYLSNFKVTEVKVELKSTVGKKYIYRRSDFDIEVSLETIGTVHLESYKSKVRRVSDECIRYNGRGIQHLR